MSRKQQVYADFSGGYNDSVPAISVKDTEVCVSENADYSAEIKSFKTRKGCTKVNNHSFGNNVTDTYGWSIGSKNKKCLVIDGKLYDLDDFNENTGQFSTIKCTLTSGVKKIYPFVIYNKFYFGDGTKLYVWGDFDFDSSEGSVSVNTNNIVKNTTSTTNGSVLGKFYKYSGSTATINLTSHDFTTASWSDVTEASYFASNVVREVVDEDKSAAEVVKISVLSGSTTAGAITINLDGKSYVTASIAQNAEVDTILNAIPSASYTESGTTVTLSSKWDYVKDGNAIILTNKTKGLCENGYVDPKTTGISLTYVTQVEGAINDNFLDPIRKCTMFVVHTSSYRVFAAGNPNDNAIFYSEIGEPNYFKSEINKVYALNSYGKPTALKQLSDSVIVSFENGWYMWQGIDPLDDAKWKPINIPYGCVSNRTVALTPNSFIFLAKDGIYNISASILNQEYVLLQSKTIIDKITKSKVDTTISNIYDTSKCEGIFDGNVYYLAYNVNEAPQYSIVNTYAVGDYCTHNSKRYVCITAVTTPEAFDISKWALSTPANDRVLKFEWDTASFTSVTGWVVNSWLTDSDGLFFGTNNYLLRANDGYADINTSTGEKKEISLYIKTKEYSFGNPLYEKVVNLIGLIFKQPKEEYDVEADINVIMGYDNYRINTINIAESLVWGRNWGLIWGFREAIVKMVELTEKSNTFQLEIRNSTLDSPLSLVAVGFVYEETDFVSVTNYKDEDLLT